MKPELGSQNKNVETSRKQVQIVLPNDRIVLMQEGKNSRNLKSLVDSFKRGEKSISSDELIRPDIASDMSEEEARTSLHNSIRRLRTITLIGKDWTIITVTDKKGFRTKTASFGLANVSYEDPSMETIILADGKTTIDLPPRAAAMFQSIKDSGENGITSKQLQQPHIDAGKSRKTARTLVRDDFSFIWATLKDKPFIIENLTTKEEYLRGESARYILMERGKEGLAIVLKQKIEARKTAEYNLRQQTRLQVTSNLLTAVNKGKLQTIEKDPVRYMQSCLSRDISEPDAKIILIEATNNISTYWNRNDWEVPDDAPTQIKEIVTVCFNLRDPRRRPRYMAERAKQEILTHFNLFQDYLQMNS